MGNNFDFESENLSVLEGAWKCLGKATIQDILPYCSNSNYILHNSWKCVFPSDLKKLPFEKRRTIELFKVVDLSIKSDGNKGFKANIKTDKGLKLDNAKITDPEFIKNLENGYDPSSKNFLITVSLSMPWKPPQWDQNDEAPCWKLIANVIEICFVG